TLLEGRAVMEVEGRRYTLSPLDTVSVPRNTAHRVLNPGERPAVFHIAMASASPTRTLIDAAFPATPMADDAAGFSGAEAVVRHAAAPWYEPSPGARFQDFFNRDLGCATLSGGYGVFAPGARLPCHVHDFDESICIVEGTATCVVEGRRRP